MKKHWWSFVFSQTTNGSTRETSTGMRLLLPDTIIVYLFVLSVVKWNMKGDSWNTHQKQTG